MSFLRPVLGRLLRAPARMLLGLGVSAAAVTVVGTLSVVVAALWFLPRGSFVAGVLVVGVVLLADGLDGVMARLSGRSSPLGGFLDSTLDRIADGAVFTGIALWAARESPVMLAACLAALVLGQVVSYARARAEVEGWDASVGMMERADRLVLALGACLAVGLGAPSPVLTVVLGVVALGSAVTVGQRIHAAVKGAHRT